MVGSGFYVWYSCPLKRDTLPGWHTTISLKHSTHLSTILVKFKKLNATNLTIPLSKDLYYLSDLESLQTIKDLNKWLVSERCALNTKR